MDEQAGISVPQNLPPLQPAGPRSGCLRWGLVGCALLSAMLIVGLVLLGMKAHTWLGWALQKMEEQTLAATTPEVTSEQREAFRRAFAGFVARAKDGKVPVEKMSDFRAKLMAAVSDGKVTPEEIQSLTVAVGDSAPSPSPKPAR